MSLPTVTRTWQFDNNITVAGTTVLEDRQAFLHEIKNALIGFASSAWTVVYSCDGTTAGTSGDGVDRITSLAQWVFANAGTAHSWIVLEQAGVGGGSLQLLISASSEGNGWTYKTYGYVGSFIISPSGGFAGGSTTARPTASDEIAFRSDGFSYAFGSRVDGNSRLISALHAHMSSDGAATRIIVCNANTCIFFLQIENVGVRGTTWTNAHCVAAAYKTVGSFPSPACAAADMCIKVPSYLYANAVMGGTKYAVFFTVEGALNNTYNGLSCDDSGYGNMANDTDSNWPMWPIGISSNAAGFRGVQGSFVDMWMGAKAIATGDTYDSSSKTFAQFGQIIVPWDGSTQPAIS